MQPVLSRGYKLSDWEVVGDYFYQVNATKKHWEQNDKVMLISDQLLCPE